MPRPLVLCVEDDPALLDSIRAALESDGFTVVTAGSGHDALRLAAETPVDAAVLGSFLPDVDSADLIEALRSSAAGLPIVIVASASGMPGDRELRLANAFVHRDAPEGTLADVLRGLLMRAGRRSAVRHAFFAPLIVRMNRPGATTAAVGRSFDLSETGLGGDLDGSLSPGQVVAMSIALPNSAEHVTTAARVAYRNGLRHGFQFLALSPAQRALLRNAVTTGRTAES